MTKIILNTMHEYYFINMMVTVICALGVGLAIAVDVSGQTDRIEAAIKANTCAISEHQLNKVEEK